MPQNVAMGHVWTSRAHFIQSLYRRERGKTREDQFMSLGRFGVFARPAEYKLNY
jgi:hypothetical protein